MKDIDYNKVCLIYCKPRAKNQIIEVVQTKNRFTRLYKLIDNKQLTLLAVLDKELLIGVLKKF